jgi:hypothetical protein
MPLGANRAGIVSQVGDAIPDSEAFEHNDLTGTYGGDTGSFAIQTGTVFEGSYALESTASGTIVRSATDKFTRDGLQIDWQYYYPSGDSQRNDWALVLSTDVTGLSSLTGYSFYYNPDNSEGLIRRFDNGSVPDSVSFSASTTAGSWNQFSASLTSSDLTFSIGGNSNTLTDNTYQDVLLGFNSFQDPMYWDDVQFSSI